jgi:hypothetical protein
MAKKVSGFGFHVSAQPLEAEWDVPGVVSRKVYQMNIEVRCSIFLFDIRYSAVRFSIYLTLAARQCNR